MDRVVAARRLVAELVKSEQLEVRRAEIVGRDLAKYVEGLGRPPSGYELEDWLGAHAQVSELYAGPAALDELVYRHLSPPPSELPPAAEARHPDLERQLREAPDSREPYLVYADWLQERADPLGELIALGVAAAAGGEEDTTRFERHLKLHEARFLGELAQHPGSRMALRWRYGMVHALEEDLGLPAPRWEELLQLRVCEALQAILLRRACTPELAAVLAEHAPASWRALSLEQHSGPLPAQLLARVRSLAVSGHRVVLGPGSLPATLERLELRVYEAVAAEGGAALDDDAAVLEPPRLDVRELHVALSAPVAVFLGGAQLPRLERLELESNDGIAPRLSELLGTLDAPALAHLAIRGGHLDAKGFAELAALPLAGRLTQLALTGLGLTDGAMRELSRHRAAFPRLAELDVSFNELSAEGLAAARQLAPVAISKRQHRRGHAMELRVRRWAGSRLSVAEGIADPADWRSAATDGELRFARYRGDRSYDLYVSADLERYGCTCPSSYQPCKHVVALALLAERMALPQKPADGVVGRVSGALVERDRFEEIEE